MKTSPKHNKNGFTLAELLVVIAIMWILVLVGINFSMDHTTNTERQKRLMQNISNTLRSEVLSNITGKSLSWWIYPDKTEIAFSTGTTGFSVKYFSGWVQIGTWIILSTPYYGDIQYKLVDISMTGANATETGMSGAIITLNRWWNTEIDHSGSILNITVGYRDIKKTLSFDRRTNTIDAQ